MIDLRKTVSHGRIGEAVVTAKCWMYGIPAHNTNGLRANFAGSDIIVDTADPRRKLLVQVKSGYARSSQVYFTQAQGQKDLSEAKFKADFVVFVNMDEKVGQQHAHDGKLGFEHFSFYVVPGDDANKLYQDAVHREFMRPKRDGGVRSLTGLAVYASPGTMDQYRDAWHLLRVAAHLKSEVILPSTALDTDKAGCAGTS
jgi:hypothetical protein